MRNYIPTCFHKTKTSIFVSLQVHNFNRDQFKSIFLMLTYDTTKGVGRWLGNSTISSNEWVVYLNKLNIQVRFTIDNSSCLGFGQASSTEMLNTHN